MQNNIINIPNVEIPREKLMPNDRIGLYKVIRYLDEGGYGKVYLVENSVDRRNYALKVLKNKKITSENIQDFDNEISMLTLLANLPNNNINNNVRYFPRLYATGQIIFEYGSHKRISKYYIIDYYPSKDLFNYIKCHILKYQRAFDENYAKIIFRNILRGIQICHDANICHLDIKVENILLDNNFNPIITDFAFARRTLDENGIFQLVNVSRGTKQYASREKYKINNQIPSYDGLKADMFSLGPLLLFLVTGKYGFDDVFDNSYRNIRKNNYNQFWQKFAFFNLSPQFKNLYNILIYKIIL